MKTWKIAALVIITELLIVVFAIYDYGLGNPGFQAVARFSGRFSLIIFSIIFLFNEKAKNSILLGKPYHIFALAHFIHLIELSFYVYKAEVSLVPVRLIGGFIAYVYLLIMPFLFELVESGKLSARKFVITEKIFQYYIWFIFFMVYLSRVRGTLPNIGGSYWDHVVLLGWVSLMMGMKITRLIIFRSSVK